MTAFVVVATYLLIGAAVAVKALRAEQTASGAGRARAAGIALLLWPYVLPFAFQRHGAAGAPATDRNHAAHLTALDAREQRLDEALRRARGTATGIDLERVARMAARLGRRLRRLEGRLAELEQAAREAPESVRGSLDSLRASSKLELESGLRLMEELTGKLTLLAFADLGGKDGAGGELAEVRELLNRLEAMACATREVAAVGA